MGENLYVSFAFFSVCVWTGQGEAIISKVKLRKKINNKWQNVFINRLNVALRKKYAITTVEILR